MIFDFIAILNGNGADPPESLPEMLLPLEHGEADAVFGFPTLVRKAKTGGGRRLFGSFANRVLTWLGNRLLHAGLSNFHSRYRIYSVAALRSVPFDRNSNDLGFDTEIIIQLLIAERSIRGVADTGDTAGTNAMT